MSSSTHTLADLLSRLRILDVHLGLDGDRLTCSAPKGVLTPELKAELGAQKNEIIRFLQSAQGLVSGASEIVATGRDAAGTLSLQQQSLWFLDQLAPGSAAYNITGAQRLTGSLNRGVLERALREILRRHDVLRTSFINEDGVPRAVVGTVGEWRMGISTLTQSTAQEREAEVIRLCVEETQVPFDLSSGPLLRARLLVLGEHEHVLLLSIHHIASDGWSLGVFVGELSELYQAFRDGKPSPLTDLSVQYSDYVQSQRRLLESGAFDSFLPYWKEQLRAPLPIADIPGDHPRPPMQTFRGGRYSLQLANELHTALQTLSLREGTTVFMVLLAALQTLLFRYTGQEDVVVGCASANRSDPQIGGLIGFFVNNLVLRTSLAGDPTVRELLARVLKTALDAYGNDVPFDYLIEVLRPQRSLSHSPLFQVMFNFQNYPFKTLELPDLTLTPIKFDGGISRFDLTLEAYKNNDGMEVVFEYNRDLFDESSIIGMQRHFEALIQSMVTDPDRRLSELSLLTASESREFDLWNDTGVDYPRDRCIHELVDARTAISPDAEAVRFAGTAFTYLELAQRSNQLAHSLQRAGVGPGKLVGILLDRSLDMVVALFGVLKAGGAYVPLDPSYPKDRLAFMMEDSGASVLVTEEKLLDLLPRSRSTLCLDRDWASIARERVTPCASGVTSQDLAYVLYTSGSTGKPKGVQIGHRSVVNFLESMRRAPGITNRDCLVSVTTLSFDIAGLEIYLPLTTGARVVLASRAVASDGVSLAALLDSCGATVMQATPATWAMLLDTGWRGTPGLKILCGGEALSYKLAEELLGTNLEVWNLYGPTETTIWSMLYKVRPGKDPVPIGRPIGNTQIYILDSKQQQVPINVPGELYIGGDGLGLGYLNRPELSAEKFVRNPFGAHPGARLYRTGDLARFRADGNVEFLGRLDSQVKVRGFRIELGEIESVLATHDAIQQVAVTKREDEDGDHRLVAYLIAREKQHGLVSADLRNWASTKLPEYMIPSAFVFLDAFPLTPNGKVDRRALPSVTYTRPQSTPVIAPRNETERIVAEIWQEVLKVESVGLHDNFFDLGGHSLLVVRVQSKLRKRFDRELSIVDLFQRPTVGALADFLTGQSKPEEFSRRIGSLVRTQNLAMADNLGLRERNQE